MEWLELNLQESILTILFSVLHSWSVSFSILWTMLVLELLHTSVEWFILSHFYTSSHLAGTVLVCGPECCICIFFLHEFSQVWLILFLSVCLHHFFGIESKFFTSCKLLMTYALALWISVLFAWVNTIIRCHCILIFFVSFLWFLLVFLSHSVCIWTVLLTAHLLLYNCIPLLLF